MSSQDSDVHTLTGAYALNALPQDDLVRFERHLADCPSCAQEVGEFGEVVARLGDVSEEAPPPELRERVLDAAREVRQVPPEVGSTGAVHRRHRWRAGWNRWWPTCAAVVAAAAVVAVAVLGYRTVTIERQLDDLQQAQGSYSQLTDVLAASDVRMVSQDMPHGGTSTAITSRDRGVAVLLTSDIPDPPEGHTYQAWVLGSNETRSAGLLEHGRTAAHQLAVHDIKQGNKLGITVEPDGGSAQPTTDPLVTLSL